MSFTIGQRSREFGRYVGHGDLRAELATLIAAGAALSVSLISARLHNLCTSRRVYRDRHVERLVVSTAGETDSPVTSRVEIAAIHINPAKSLELAGSIKNLEV